MAHRMLSTIFVDFYVVNILEDVRFKKYTLKYTLVRSSDTLKGARTIYLFYFPPSASKFLYPIN